MLARNRKPFHMGWIAVVKSPVLTILDSHNIIENRLTTVHIFRKHFLEDVACLYCQKWQTRAGAHLANRSMKWFRK